MATVLPPPPVYAPQGSYAWDEWYRQLAAYVAGSGGLIAWNAVSKTGANITDIPTRNHNNLQNIQGGTSGEFYHLTEAYSTGLQGLSTDTSGTTTLVAASNGYRLANATAGNITYNLPSATIRKRFHIKKIDSSVNTVTIARAGTDTFEGGGASLVINTQFKSYTIYSDGTSVWYIESAT